MHTYQTLWHCVGFQSEENKCKCISGSKKEKRRTNGRDRKETDDGGRDRRELMMGEETEGN